MSARPCRLCFGTGSRFVIADAPQPDGPWFVLTLCPCLNPIAVAYLEAVDARAREAIDAADLPVREQQLEAETEGSSA